MKLKKYFKEIKESPLIKKIESFIDAEISTSEGIQILKTGDFNTMRREMVSFLNKQLKPNQLNDLNFQISPAAQNNGLRDEIKVKFTKDNLSLILLFDLKLRIESQKFTNMTLALDRITIKRFYDDSLVVDCNIGLENSIGVHHYKSKEERFNFYETKLFFRNSFLNDDNAFGIQIGHNNKIDKNTDSYEYSKKLQSYTEFFVKIKHATSYKFDDIMLEKLYDDFTLSIFENKNKKNEFDIFKLMYDLEVPNVDPKFCFDIPKIIKEHLCLERKNKPTLK